MAENDIKSFDFDGFAKDLSGQAGQVIPADLKPQDKAFIIDIIYRFCKMAGEALTKEENSKLNADEAGLITQFIGEWIFHKSVDVTRANIDIKYREGILQKVAFTVFDIAKKAVEKQMPQEQLINLVEAQVKKCFAKTMDELKEKGILTEEVAKNALLQSNIDAMAQEQVQEEIEQESACISDEKMIKLASLAVLMKGFTSEKMKNILQKFEKPERDVLIKYLKLPDLEEKLDAKAMIRCFEEMKNTLPETVVVSNEKIFKKMCKIVKNSDKTKILNIIEKERPVVHDYVLSCYERRRKNIPPHIADVISKYLEENAS
ncbi:MAG: hypothetical protein IJ003_02520 [Candidatus Gastranaerophilales bacterium]|nr:hypothetical protein [Candidatus Gastranaerophilales bacterium]